MVQKKSKLPEKAKKSQQAGDPPRPRRGRPRQYDPEHALGKAGEAFWKLGYAATSLDDLAAATGMNRPSLYAAFGDKRDIYLKTLERYRERSRAIGVQILADDPPLRIFLKRFYDAALDIYLGGGEEARGCYSISTAPAQATTDHGVREFLAASIAGTDTYLAKQIDKARERGEVASNADPAALAQIATGVMHTIAVRARAGIARKQLQALAAAVIDLICGPAVRGGDDERSGKNAGKAQAAE
jgi:TetR/AcrR family transcriptional regulator, copper-responsive repressor